MKQLPETSPRHGAPRRRLVALVLFVALSIGVTSTASAGEYEPVQSGPLTQDERNFLQYVIFNLKDTATARLWVKARSKDVRGQGKGDLAYFLADCIRIDGDFDGFVAQTQKLAGQFPRHPRSGGAKLDAVRAKMATVLQLSLEARLDSDPAKKEQLRQDRTNLFDTEVESPLAARVDKLRKKLESAEEPDLSEMKELADWAHYRITAWMLYARDFAEGTAESKAAYEKVLELATYFVDEQDQTVAFGHVCDAQLQKGRALAALGQPADAAEAFEILVEISPPMDGPYEPNVVRAIVQLRLQALQGTAEAYNRSGQPDKAVEIFDLVYSSNSDPYISLSTARKDPALAGAFFTVDVEEAVSRAAGESPHKGFTIVRRLLAAAEDVRRRDPKSGQGMAQEVAVGLSRLVDVGMGGLSPEWYYRAGYGYKARGLYGTAVKTWQRAMAAPGDPAASALWRDRALFEIAETSYLLERTEESALGFLLYLEIFPDGERKAKAAGNAYSMCLELEESFGEPWTTLTAKAEALFAKMDSGMQSERLKLQNAIAFQEQGLYTKARNTYLLIRKSINSNGSSEPVPFYYSSRAAAATCLFQEGRGSGNANDERSKAIVELEALDREAKTDGKNDGRAAALNALASIYWDETERELDKVCDTLAPLATEVRGTSDFRENGLYLWVVALVAAGNVDEAETKLTIIEKDFADTLTVPKTYLELVEAHQAAEEDVERHLKRSGVLAEKYTKHPKVNFSALEIPVLGWLADAMIRGGNPNGALPVLNAAKDKLGAGSSPDEKIGVLFSFAKAANAAGEPQQALQILDELLQEFPEMRQGLIADAPYVYLEQAKAKLMLNEKAADRKLLQQAERSFEACIGILQQRIHSLKIQGLVVPETMNRDFWWAYLHYLKTQYALDKWELVGRDITRLRGPDRAPKFAPADLQKQFDELEKKCKGKK